LFAPFLIQSFNLADELAEAMEALGFGAPHRTFAKDYALHRLDVIVMALAIIPVFVGWYAR
jgi:energy-coupling factor transport system permease protein